MTNLSDLVRKAAPHTPCLVVGGDYEQALAGAPRTPLPSAASWTPMFYTSGTTGRPKGVVQGSFTPARMTAAQDGQRQPLVLDGRRRLHRLGAGVPRRARRMGHDRLLRGGDDGDPSEVGRREWLRLVERHRVTRSFMVPAHFIRILEAMPTERDLSSLRLIVHGAAPCPVDVKRRIMEALAPAAIWELYGMSEGGATRISPDEWKRKPGSVGTPWPGVEIRILDEDGRELGPGEDGLIHVLPPGGLRFQYRGDPGKTAEAWRPEGFTVGDIGHLDADGYLYVTDRKSDMVIRGGVNIYPREVEEALHRHPAVVDCAVFGVPDDRYGEQLMAVVEARAPVTGRRAPCALPGRSGCLQVPRALRHRGDAPPRPCGEGAQAHPAANATCDPPRRRQPPCRPVGSGRWRNARTDSTSPGARSARRGRSRPPRAGPGRPLARGVSAPHVHHGYPRHPRTLNPGSALARLRPVVFHATAYGAWESIAAHGLRTAAQLSDDARSLSKLRTSAIEVKNTEGLTASVRDQQVMIRSHIADHLDGLTVDEWLELVNSRVFFFARQKDLTTLLGRYGSEGQDVLTFDTAKLLAAAGRRAEVATVETAAPVAWQKCPCRGIDTFEPLAEHRGDVADIEELTVVDGLTDVMPLVRRVVRHHGRGGTPEVIVG